jgi:hypothetical protein
MEGGWYVFGMWEEQRLLIEIVFENGVNTFVRVTLDCQGTDACIFKPFRTVVIGQTDDAEGGSEPLFRMRSAFHDPGDKFFCAGSVFGCPLDDPGRRPLKVSLMAFGHVFRKSGKLSGQIASLMADHSSIFEKDLYGC